MLLDNPTTDKALGLFVLDNVARLWQANPQNTITQALRDIGLDTINFRFMPASRDNPAWYIGGNQNYAVFFGAGASEVSQGDSLLSGYGRGNAQAPTTGINSYLTSMVRTLAGTIGIRPLIGSDKILFAGHSLGGAMALAAHAFIKAANFTGRRKAITFGSPRTGDDNFLTLMEGEEVTRWMNDDDPVPLIPPLLTQVPTLALAYPFQAFVNWSFQRHAQGGLEIKADSTMTERLLPSAAVINPGTSLAAWLIELATDAIGSHSVATYHARLKGIPEGLPVRQRRRPDELPPEPPRQQEPHVVREEVRLAVDRIIRRGNAQNQGPIILPPRQIFRNVSRDGKWYCVFGDIVISYGPTRRKSGLLAQRGNAFLRKLQRQSVVDPTALVHAWVSYLIAAQDPASGIRPVLSIGVAQ